MAHTTFATVFPYMSVHPVIRYLMMNHLGCRNETLSLIMWGGACEHVIAVHGVGSCKLQPATDRSEIKVIAVFPGSCQRYYAAWGEKGRKKEKKVAESCRNEKKTWRDRFST